MKKTNCLFTLSVAALCAGGGAYAVGTAPAFMSNYGEIQSVKNYSSNPFWNKNSPYNQNMPKPIYATGADLNTGDCNRVVENLITAYCTEHNYCTNMRLSDVRPTIMVQLSQLPGHNFATSCGGYIDSTFEKFQKQYGNTSAVNIPKPTTQTANIQIANPFAQKPTAEQMAVAERTAELERLHSMTTPTPTVSAADFPKTTADLSFTDRLANTTAGYEPYKDLPSYRTPTFHDEDEAFFEKLKAQNPTEYCKRRPEDCKNTPPQKTKPPKGNGNTDGDSDGDDNGGGNNGGGSISPASAPQCLIDVANDANFKSSIAAKLAGATDLNKWITNNKTTFYTIVADYVIKHCLKSTADKLTEFNTFLDTSAPLPISVDFNGTATVVSFDKLELFDYATYWTYPIVINNGGVKNVGAPLPKSATSLPEKKRQCTGPFYKTSIITPSLAKTAIEAAARPVYPKTSGEGFMLGNVSFPGMLYNYHQTFTGATGGMYLIKTKNYASAREQIKKFVEGVISDGECAGNNIVIYLVSEPTPDEDNAQTVKIMSEPFVIR